MSPTRQEITARPNLHADIHKFTDAHMQIHAQLGDISLYSSTLQFFTYWCRKYKKLLSSSLLLVPFVVSVLSLSDCVQQDKAKTGGMTARPASDQGADRVD